MAYETIRRVVESTLVPHTAFQHASARIRQCLAHSLHSPEPICLAIVGESRTGKSRVLEECEIELPPRRTSEGMEVHILRVSAPSKPTVKGLAELMLQKLGDPKWDSGTENNKTVRLARLLKACRTRMLMVDEFQHFFDKSTHEVFHHVADWLKILADSTKVALVVTGLESCLPVLLRNEQLSGRFLAPAFMHRFNWLDDEHRAEYVAILSAFHESLSAHFDVPALDNEEMAYRCWCATGGLMGYLAKFLRQVVWDACDAQRRSISLADLQSAHAKAIWSVAASAMTRSPFARNFSVQPTQEMVARALTVGVREEKPAATRSHRTRRNSTGKSVSQHLTAS